MTKAQSSNRWRCIRRGISSADREAEKYNDECCWTLSLCVLANGMVKTAYELMLLIFCSSFLLLICCTVVPESISGIHLCQLGDTKKDERKLSEEKSKSELQSTTAFLLTIHFIHSLSAVVIIKARICFFLLTQTTQMVDCVSQLVIWPSHPSASFECLCVKWANQANATGNCTPSTEHTCTKGW